MHTFITMLKRGLRAFDMLVAQEVLNRIDLLRKWLKLLDESNAKIILLIINLPNINLIGLSKELE